MVKEEGDFKKELARLNTAQHDAVSTIEGPVLVIAGPGTGKTQILAARVGYILDNTDTEPENILCLTYTDAGAIAMRKRLVQFIGPAAYRVTINTFHAFCNSVIQDNLDVFGIRRLDPISELEQVELFRELVDTFGPDHPLKRYTGDVYYEVGRLKNLFQIMKKEDWSAELIEKRANEYLEELPSQEGFYYKRANSKKGIEKGDPNEGKIAVERKRMEELVAAAKEFDKYQEMMLKKRRYDYDDMILMVLRQFQASSDSDMLLQYQEQYHYFLVDEFQDTNGSQNEILELLINYWNKPNVFVVGDDDQSIYRFQGASVENITKYSEQHKDHLQLVMMTDNYRSTQPILDTSKALIEHNKGRLVNQIAGLSKDLKAKNPDLAASSIKPNLIEYTNLAHETVAIANQIISLKEQGQPLSEIAVIYRNHRQSEDIVRYLAAKQIPVNIKRRANILESVFIRQILQLLRYVDAEAAMPHSRQDLLFEVMHFNFFGLDPLLIAEITLQMRHRTAHSPKSWREAIKKKGETQAQTLFDQANQSYAALRKLSENLESWIGDVANTTLQTLLERITTRGGILRHIMESPDKFGLMDELNSLFEFLKSESVKNPNITVSEFLDQLDNMEDHNIALQINRSSYSEEGVNFVTAHSSKGLEFEYVFILGCTAKDWDKKGRTYTYKFPDNMTTKVEEGDDVEESRRLFYVAMTRAKQHLHISYPKANLEGKELEASRFVSEIVASTLLDIEETTLPNEQLFDFNMILLQEPALPDVKLLEKQQVGKLLEKYELSVTHLNNYLRCPLAFYFENLLRVPQAKNQYMAFGSGVHYAIERLFRDMQDGKSNTFKPASFLVNEFEWYIKRHEDSFTPEEYVRRLEYGRKILPEYYKKYVNEWSTIVSVEKNFRGVEVGGVPINGKLDKLEFDNQKVNVVDYKTGSYENNRKKKRFNPPVEMATDDASHEEKYGGNYWRQAVFYKLLVDGDHRNTWKVESTEFDFIEPDRKSGEYHRQKIHITDDDLATVKEQIQTVYGKIKAQEFNEGCGEETCKWCTFGQQNYTSDISIQEGEAD